MSEDKELNKERALTILNKISFFDDLNREEKLQICDYHWHFITYESGDLLTEESSLDKRFFILLSGGANVIKGAKQQLIVQLHPGDIVGEISFLTNEPRTASVVANTSSSALVIDQALLNQLPIEVREKIKDQIILRLVWRLNRMNNRFTLAQI